MNICYKGAWQSCCLDAYFVDQLWIILIIGGLVGWLVVGFLTIYPYKNRGNMFHNYHGKFHLITRNSSKVSPSASCMWHTVQYLESSTIYYNLNTWVLHSNI